MPKSSIFEFLERFLANKFALSDAEYNLCGPLNRGGIYSRFTIVERLLVTCQKSQEPSFWEVMDAFVLVAYASLAASRIHLQKLLG